MAHSRHKREPNARRIPRATQVAAGIAALTTVPAVALGVVAHPPRVLTADTLSTASTYDAQSLLAHRDAGVSRSSSRVDRSYGVIKRTKASLAEAATRKAVAAAHEHRWTTAELNLWPGPSTESGLAGTVPAGKHVLVTGRSEGDRAEIVWHGQSRWVTAAYLSADKPQAEPAAVTAGLSMAPCPDGSVENGLVPGAVRVYRAVCHAFPQITSYGGWDAHGEHSSGKAIDIMTSDKALGDQIAAFLQSHASELDLYDVIWWDRIWTPVRAAEGWRAYGDHGSPTANHMDHVHVSVN